MCSAGLRAGAIPVLKVKDLEPIDKYHIYKIIVYAKSKRFRYFTFCTPECRMAIDEYLEWRKRFGERLNDDTVLFRRDYNATGERIPYPIPIARSAIEKAVRLLLLQTGLRTVPLEGLRRRYSTMVTHGFRKAFQTTAITAGMSPLYSEFLMGHKSGGLPIESYVRPSEKDLLEGNDKMIGYVGVIDSLTINEENKLRLEVHKLQKEKGEWDQIRREIDELKKSMRL
jgi:hypothetical protein